MIWHICRRREKTRFARQLEQIKFGTEILQDNSAKTPKFNANQSNADASLVLTERETKEMI